MGEKLEQPGESNPNFVERRKEYRLNIRMPITVSGTHPETLEEYTFNVQTQNVSRYGASFELVQGMTRVGSLMNISVGKRFDAKARVVWVRAASEGMDMVGVEFTSATGQWVLYN